MDAAQDPTMSARAAHGIMFHHCHGPGHAPSPGSVSGSQVGDILRLVGPGRILSPEDWLRRLEGGGLREADLCLSFDDGLLSQIDVALPVVERLGLKAFWFVYSGVFRDGPEAGRLELYRRFRAEHFPDVGDFYRDFFARVARSAFAARAADPGLEAKIARLREGFRFYSESDARFRVVRDEVLGPQAYDGVMGEMIAERGLTLAELGRGLWMTDEHLRYLAGRGHSIGLHSYSHPTVLARLPEAEQREEYGRNFRHIREACGRDPVAAAHPVNSYGPGTLDILRGLGIRCAFRSNMAAPRAGGALNPGPLELARRDHADFLPLLSQGGVR